MTYNVFGGTLSLTQSINQLWPPAAREKWMPQWPPIYSGAATGIAVVISVITVVY